MNCLRCGFCCHKLSVVIVTDPELGIGENNFETHNGPGPCKHLRGDKSGEYSCAIHNESWYPETPCAHYNQIGKGDCRMGRAVMDGELRTKYPELEWSWGNTLRERT